jgi:hypothetical protein
MTTVETIPSRLNNEEGILKVQIIKRKVDPECLTGSYYSQVKNDIKRKIKEDTELLLIKIIPKNPISEKWILETLMYLQRELTSVVTVPKNTVNMKKEDFEEFEKMFNCNILQDQTP